jgi:signal transduction histidine kinase
MVSKRLRRTAIRRTLFGAIVSVLTAAIGFLGWRVLAQDQQLARQRLAEDREVAADLVVADFERRLSSIERDLDAALRDRESVPPAVKGAVLVRITADGVRAWPEGSLRYHPVLPPAPATPEAEALVQRAQLALKAGDTASAVDSYDRLERFGAIRIGDVVGGIPAALFARLGRLTAYERRDDRTGQSKAAQALDEALRSGRWSVSAATYQFLDEQVRRILPDRPAEDNERATADAVEWLWNQRQAEPAFPASGRIGRMFDSRPALIVWRSSPATVVAAIAPGSTLEREWIPALRSVTDPRRPHVAISTPEGQPIVRSRSATDRAVRLASETRLPWTIHVTNVASDDTFSDRRRLLLAGMATLFMLIVAGAWLIERTIAREVAVAELQSDFVSAVSHEFRTPLTTLCQLSEMLVRDRVASDDDRRQYYQLLHGESHRLRRLVETLLNFGRLEAGRMEFRVDDVDLGALVRRTVEEFSRSQQARVHRVELSSDGGESTLRADAEMLRTVLWNLLENAAKYSPDCDTIFVSVSRGESDVSFRVRDRGVGIPREEQRQVFEKFVRGASARASGVGGTGIGLAMARRIVEAHGGHITVESAPGAGSTFTVTLPTNDAQFRSDLKVGPYDRNDLKVAPHDGVEAAG